MLFSSNFTPSTEDVEMLVSNMTRVTSVETTGDTSHFPLDLKTTNMVMTMVMEFLLDSTGQDNPEELLPFNEV